MPDFAAHVLRQPHRLILPILTFPGSRLAGVTVRQMVTSAPAQCAAVAALHRRYGLAVVLSAMDLSAEAEAFGCDVRFSEDEVPTVHGRRVTDRATAERLPVPEPGGARTQVHLDTVGRLRSLPGHPFVMGGMIGPFSLAARIYGVGEALGLTLEDPALAHLLLEKATTFLTAYAAAFKTAGADGVIMAEPTAGLLSPRALAAFSSAYIRRIVTAVDGPDFTVIIHNCGAKLVHLPQILESQARVFHFGAPMDLPAALAQVPTSVVLCGNLDPSRVFVQSQPGEIATATQALLAVTAGHRNHVLSSGCDIPPQTPPANLDAFFEAARAGQ